MLASLYPFLEPRAAGATGSIPWLALAITAVALAGLVLMGWMSIRKVRTEIHEIGTTELRRAA